MHNHYVKTRIKIGAQRRQEEEEERARREVKEYEQVPLTLTMAHLPPSSQALKAFQVVPFSYERLAWEVLQPHPHLSPHPFSSSFLPPSR